MSLHFSNTYPLANNLVLLALSQSEKKEYEQLLEKLDKSILTMKEGINNWEKHAGNELKPSATSQDNTETSQDIAKTNDKAYQEFYNLLFSRENRPFFEPTDGKMGAQIKLMKKYQEEYRDLDKHMQTLSDENLCRRQELERLMAELQSVENRLITIEVLKRVFYTIRLYIAQFLHAIVAFINDRVNFFGVFEVLTSFLESRQIALSDNIEDTDKNLGTLLQMFELAADIEQLIQEGKATNSTQQEINTSQRAKLENQSQLNSAWKTSRQAFKDFMDTREALQAYWKKLPVDAAQLFEKWDNLQNMDAEPCPIDFTSPQTLSHYQAYLDISIDMMALDAPRENQPFINNFAATKRKLQAKVDKILEAKKIELIQFHKNFIDKIGSMSHPASALIELGKQLQNEKDITELMQDYEANWHPALAKATAPLMAECALYKNLKVVRNYYFRIMGDERLCSTEFYIYKEAIKHIEGYANFQDEAGFKRIIEQLLKNINNKTETKAKEKIKQQDHELGQQAMVLKHHCIQGLSPQKAIIKANETLKQTKLSEALSDYTTKLFFGKVIWQSGQLDDEAEKNKNRDLSIRVIEAHKNRLSELLSQKKGEGDKSFLKTQLLHCCKTLKHDLVNKFGNENLSNIPAYTTLLDAFIKEPLSNDGKDLISDLDDLLKVVEERLYTTKVRLLGVRCLRHDEDTSKEKRLKDELALRDAIDNLPNYDQNSAGGGAVASGSSTKVWREIRDVLINLTDAREKTNTYDQQVQKLQVIQDNLSIKNDLTQITDINLPRIPTKMLTLLKKPALLNLLPETSPLYKELLSIKLKLEKRLDKPLFGQLQITDELRASCKVEVDAFKEKLDAFMAGIIQQSSSEIVDIHDILSEARADTNTASVNQLSTPSFMR